MDSISSSDSSAAAEVDAVAPSSSAVGRESLTAAGALPNAPNNTKILKHHNRFSYI